MKINVDEDVKFILDTLNSNGKGYIVGGYLRDSLLGLTPKDCDFVTDIPYDEIKKIFKNQRTEILGKSFKIIMMRIKGKIYEISNFRGKDLEEDLRHRDFTINAIAYDGKRIYSLKNSLEDLDKKLIRFSENPKIIIEEDPLRMLRAVRFAAEKGFKIIMETETAIKENSERVATIHEERIKMELDRILLSSLAAFGISKLYEYKLLDKFIPLLKNPDFTNMDNSEKDLTLRLSLLLCYSGHISDAVHILKKLSYGKIRELVAKILSSLSVVSKKYDRKECRRFLRNIGPENLHYIESFLRIIKSSECDKFIKTCRNIIEAEEPLYRRDLVIRAEDLMKLGITDGKLIGELLERCMEEVLENPENNKKEFLLSICNQIF